MGNDENTRTISSNGPRGEAPRSWGTLRLLEKVGEGGFGEVYRAFDTVLEREVALKLLLRATRQESDQSEALREARAIAKVKHPNILTVYGIDFHDGRVGFWSDFVRGQTLSALVKTQGPLGPREAAMVGIDVCKAVSAVHGAGLLHRDIKASNVMREAGGRILLMDFGLTHDQREGTRMGGTPSYMSPELMAGKPATVASDVYAIGVLLFYLLTGKHPVEGANFSEIQEAHANGSHRRLMDERPDLPEQMAHVIEKAMTAEPNQRYASAGQLIAALSESAGLNAGTVTTAGPAVVRKRKVWPIGVAAIVGAALGLYFMLNPAHTFRPFGGLSGLSGKEAHASYLQALELLDHYYRPHNTENAVKLLQETVEKDPKFASGFAALGRALWMRYRDTHDPALVDPAKVACTRALELDKDIASAHVTLGMIYTEAGRSDAAEEELKAALGLNQRNAAAYSALAELYHKEGRGSEVEPMIQKAIDLAPEAWAYINQLGSYYLSVGNYGGAVEQYQKAARLDPQNARALNQLGVTYRREGRLDEARMAYENSLSIEPAVNTLSNLGIMLQTEGKNEEAAKIYLRAAEMNPTNFRNWSNLASAYNRIPGSKAKAKETYLKAISVVKVWLDSHPTDAEAISDLGVFYAAVADSEKSAPLLRQSAALAPANPLVLYRVAEGYELLGQRTDALRWIGKALQSGLSLDIVKRNPELAGLRDDPKFPGAKLTDVR